MDERTSYADSAAEMRQAFDRSFAEPPRSELRETESFLAVRLGNDRYAIRLTETAGLFADRKVIRLPSPIPELRGIAGLRGAVLPVYDLAALLGYPSASAVRWLVVAKGASVAFAFEAFDGQLRIDLTAVVSHDGGTSREHVREVARTADLIRPIVNLPSVLAAIGQRMPAAGQQREQKR
jgi:chemotaxis signal transduction protein